ncbi:protein STPG3 isoform X1 [Talpa occidentalis]|uniref:protein STPG3 isoform X1 n=1 Tax=Talpa occidentalis TaxID=50954 RepID=UPI0023F9FF0D|nr:protein STPG3 isoform X1 [Talpa occidentalis]
MNFDQKAVKFLASFHVNGGRHWAHGPLRQGPLTRALNLGWWAGWGQLGVAAGGTVPRDLLQAQGWSGTGAHLGHHAAPKGAEVSSQPQEENGHPAGALPWLHPQPEGAGAGATAPHPYRPGHPGPHHVPEGGGRRAWHSVWLQSESPFTQKTDFNQELKWPSPADYLPRSRPAHPAFSFGGHCPAPKTPEAHYRLGQLLARGVGPQTPPSSEAQGDKRPGPNAYNIVPGSRLRSPHPPAFSMGQSPASASWIRSPHTPGPAAYHVEHCFDSRFPAAPGVLIQGVRRPKRHDTGPFCAI